MPDIILTDTSVSKPKKPMATLGTGEGYPVAILNRNQPAFNSVPAERSNQTLLAVDLDSCL